MFNAGNLTVAGYEVTVPSATKAWVSVHQQDSRDITAQPYIDMGVSILASDRKTLVASTGIDVDRQIQLEVDLPAGMVVILRQTRI